MDVWNVDVPDEPVDASSDLDWVPCPEPDPVPDADELSVSSSGQCTLAGPCVGFPFPDERGLFVAPADLPSFSMVRRASNASPGEAAGMVASARGS